MNTDVKTKTARVNCIDVMRSLTMLLMLFVNDIPGTKNVPHWLFHAAYDEDMLGFSDTIFPAFLFCVGLSVPFALGSRLRRGDSQAGVLSHVLWRTFALVMMGLFTLNGDIAMDPDETVGIDEEYVPEFTMGSAKYSVKKTVGVESLLTKVGLTPVSGNIVGAFVGNECRGVATLSVSGFTQLDIYGRNTGEAVTLRYYDVASYILYTLTDPVNI